MKRLDLYLIIIILVIFCLGVLFQYSVSFEKPLTFKESPLLKQLIWAGLGLIISLVIIKLGHRRILSFAYPLYAVSIFFLIIVLFLGKARFGAHRWISLGWFNFQPSELTKLTLILVLANYLGHNKESLSSRKFLLTPVALTVLPVFLILIEPDL